MMNDELSVRPHIELRSGAENAVMIQSSVDTYIFTQQMLWDKGPEYIV